MKIYWIENKTKKGPISVPELISRVQMGELTVDTLGWHAGCEKWMPLRELPALADCLHELAAHTKGESVPPPGGALPPLPPIPPAPAAPAPVHIQLNIPANGVAFPGDPIEPAPIWARLTARLVDYTLYATLVMAIMYALRVPFNEYLIPSAPTFWLPMLFVEAILLNTFSTTPGKKLMGISISTIGEGNNLTFGRAFARSFSVMVLGMGCFLFPFNIIMMLVAYFMLRRRGITLWDARALTMPIRRVNSGAGGMITAALTLVIGVHLIGFFMQPWVPSMLDRISSDSPQLAEKLQKYMKLPHADKN